MYKETLKYLAGVTAFTLVYVAAAKFGLWLVPGVQNSVTPVWPPAGIALAVILVFGYRFWPGILIGAFAITAFSGFPVTTALGIGVGSTPRELEILTLVGQGLSNKLIARALEITEGTVKTHVKNLLEKLDATSRTEAVAVAARRGLIKL
jgi:DNA-binding CsgD family transcriptional regulator